MPQLFALLTSKAHSGLHLGGWMVRPGNRGAEEKVVLQESASILMRPKKIQDLVAMVY